MIRPIHRPTHASQMQVSPASSTEPYLDTSREVGSWWFKCHAKVEQVDLDYFLVCYLLNMR